MTWKRFSISNAIIQAGWGALIGIILIVGGAHYTSAAELRGSIREQGANSAPAGAVVHAKCGPAGGESRLAGDGRYSIRNLPSGKACELWVRIGNLASPRIPFTTSGPVARFSGQVRRRGNGLILMPD